MRNIEEKIGINNHFNLNDHIDPDAEIIDVKKLFKERLGIND